MNMTSRFRHRPGFMDLCLGLFTSAIVLAPHTVAPAGANLQPGRQAVTDGEEIYMTRCMACHQVNGGGVPGVFPPLVDTEWVTGDKGVLTRIVLNGMTGPVEVSGLTYASAMPPWGDFMSDEEMARLLTYVRTSWGNEASEVTPEEVQKIREAVKDRTEPWTAEELEDEANHGIPSMPVPPE